MSNVWACVWPLFLVDSGWKDNDLREWTHWKRSYNGVASALFVLEFQLLTTPDELSAMVILPRCGGWGARKVAVARGSIMCTVKINAILTGNTKMQTAAEKAATNARMSVNMKASRPCGVATTQKQETSVTNALYMRIGLQCAIFNIEFRLADVLIAVPQLLYAGDQTKTSNMGDNGRLNFSLNIRDARLIIGGGNFISNSTGNVKSDVVWQRMSLTLIAMVAGVIKVVWYLRGQEALDMMKPFPEDQKFHLRLYLKRPSCHAFMKEINDSKWRFNVGASIAATAESECARLFEAINAFTTGDFAAKKPIEFWNYDRSQIPLVNHRKENDGFTQFGSILTQHHGGTVFRSPIDNSGPIDFHVITPNGKNVRIQHKLVTAGYTVGNDYFSMGGNRGVPYNLLIDFDSLDVYDLRTDIVYSLPARIMTADGKIISYISPDELYKSTVNLSKAWKKRHAAYCCDLKYADGVIKYMRLQDERV